VVKYFFLFFSQFLKYGWHPVCHTRVHTVCRQHSDAINRCIMLCMVKYFVNLHQQVSGNFITHITGSKRKHSSWNEARGLPSSTLLSHTQAGEAAWCKYAHSPWGRPAGPRTPAPPRSSCENCLFPFPHLPTRADNGTCSCGGAVNITWVTTCRTSQHTARHSKSTTHH